MQLNAEQPLVWAALQHRMTGQAQHIDETSPGSMMGHH